MSEVIDLKEKRFYPAVDAIQELLRDPEEEILMVAIDGKCGSGKTRLAEFLSRKLDANVFHMDDFFLRPEQRTEERMQEVGGNVDYERFREEVLIPLFYGDPVVYRPFRCSIMGFRPEDEITIPPKRLNIIEGSYSQHPYFGNPYQLRIFMDIDEETRRQHIFERSGEEKLKDFIDKWIPKEDAYFERYNIKEKSDLVISWS